MTVVVVEERRAWARACFQGAGSASQAVPRLLTRREVRETDRKLVREDFLGVI